jgi:hypothetical protein
VLCDGEMRRYFFVQTFYGRMEGLETLEPLRKTGLYAYDSVPRYRARARISVPRAWAPSDFQYLGRRPTGLSRRPSRAPSRCPSTCRRGPATPTTATAWP